MKKLIKQSIAIFLMLALVFSGVVVNKNVKADSKKVYKVPVQLWHAENTGRLSMGNGAVVQTATVEELDNGTSNITIQFIPMDFMEMHGHLLSLSIHRNSNFTGGLTKAKVIETYEDTNLDGGKSTYGGKFLFNRPKQKEKQIGVRVHVDAMDAIMGGDASQNAILNFDWSKAKLTSGKEDKNNKEKKSENKKEEKKSDKKKDESKIDPKIDKEKLKNYFKESKKTKEPDVYSVDITAAYLNPLTGITADGGTKNVEIGFGMCQGVISPVNAGGSMEEAMKNQKNTGERRWSKAMLQRTKDGKLYATVRIHMMNWVKRSKEQGPFIKVLQEDGSFKLADVEETKVNIEKFKDSYVDYRFEVPNENFLAMIQMFVNPMNRPVRYFVEVNPDTIKLDNTLDMEVKSDLVNLKVAIPVGILVIVVIGGAVFYIRKNKKTNIGEDKNE